MKIKNACSMTNLGQAIYRTHKILLYLEWIIYAILNSIYTIIVVDLLCL